MARPAYIQRQLSCGSLAPLQLTGIRGSSTETTTSSVAGSHSASAPSLAQLDTLWHFDCVISPRSPASTAAFRHPNLQSNPSSPRSPSSSSSSGVVDGSPIGSPPTAALGRPSSGTLPTVDLLSPSSPTPSNSSSSSSPLSRFAAATSSSAAAGQKVLQRVFSIFDENGDGCVSIHEISNVLDRLGLPASEYSIQSLLAGLLRKSQEHVNEQEFLQLYGNVCSMVEELDGASASASSMDGDELGDLDLLAAFHVFDKDGDGFISPSELQSVLCALGFPQARQLDACVDMIARVDENGDGQVDFLEFKKLFHLQHPFDVVMETSVQSF